MPYFCFQLSSILDNLVQSGRSWVKVDGSRELNWAVQGYESEMLFTKLDGPKGLKVDGH